MKAIFDIETDGVNASKVWCIAAQIYGMPWETYFFDPSEVGNFKQWLVDNEIDTLIGHNIIGFDIPVLNKLLDLDWSGDIEDTLVMARLDDPSRKNSLGAWGERLNFPKDNFKEFNKYSEEMKEYCIQDVRVTYRVYDMLKGQMLNPNALKLEHEVAAIIHQQKENGWKMDYIKASRLLAKLKGEMFKAENEVREVFKPLPVWVPMNHPLDKLFKGKFINQEYSARFQAQLDKGGQFNEEGDWGHFTYPEFNLGSRQQIIKYLIHFGWEPKRFTEHGQAIVSEEILESIDIPEGKLIAKYLMLQKRTGLVSSWLNELHIDDERIHGNVNSCGTRTGRMTHNKPNLAQVPAVYSPYGEDCRELFIVEKGYKLVGVDASGLELRMLAHYINDEDYIKEILEGDIHTANQNAAGLETRDQAKTFIYALLYGGGDGKIGEIVGGGVKEGKDLKDKFFTALPAMKELRDKVTEESQGGTILGLDGRKLKVNSPHTALNTLLQSAGAIVMKKALVILDHAIPLNLIDAKFVGNIHDEFQLEVREDQADALGELAVNAIIAAGEEFKMNCPLDGEYKVGLNWKETH